MAYEIDYEDYQRALQFDQRHSRMATLQQLTQILVDELDLQETDKVLDVGTGTGRLGISLCNLVPRGSITGIDSGYGMLRVAEDKIQRDQIANFHIVRGRAEALPFLSQVFDSAYLMLSFHHFTEPERAITELYRVLRTEGSCVSVDPVLKEAEDEEEKRLNGLIEEAFQLAHGPEFRFFTSSELRGLFEKGGFSVEACQIYNVPFRQRRIEEIPMGSHWLQARELLQIREEEGLIGPFEQNYFTFMERGRRLIVQGKMRWNVIKATRR
jgi:ubiquinone/menaquinone biosynthesis C-methylase UbiE